MRPNTFVPGIVTTALVVALAISPFGLPNAVSGIRAAKAESTKIENYALNEQMLSNMVVEAQNKFADSREFDVYFGDVSGIYSVLKNIAGIEIKGHYQVDPMNNFVEKGMVHEGSTPAAVRFDLLVSDVDTALKVIQKMELPLAQVSYSEPNTLSVTFLTGGALN